jgi:hypothetical protein
MPILKMSNTERCMRARQGTIAAVPTLTTERLELWPITLPFVEAVMAGDRATAEAVCGATLPVAWPGGALDVGARIAASDDDRDDTDLGVAIGGAAGWTWVFNRASSVRAAAEVTLDAGELFFGARITGSYGFLDAAFARSAP